MRAGKHLRTFGLSPGEPEWANRAATHLSVSAFLPSGFANLDPYRLSPRQRVFFSHRTAGAGDIGARVFTGGGDGPPRRAATLGHEAIGPAEPIVPVTGPRTSR